MYRGNERILLESYKYDGIKAWAGFFAMHLLKEIQTHYGDVVIVAVPTSMKTIEKRGWGHMEEIARLLQKCRISVVTDCLKKRKGTSQKALDKDQRRTNAQKLFFVDNGQAIAGKHILLIDDVYTTGATLDACASLIEFYKPLSVKCLTLYRD